LIRKIAGSQIEAVKLVAVTGAYGNALAALGPAARQHGRSALGLHAGAKAVNLRATAAIRLKCALRHGTALLNFFLWKMLPGRHRRKCHFQTKIEYTLFASQPQNTRVEPTFSQSVVQPYYLRKK
jgi:hypothetical protein